MVVVVVYLWLNMLNIGYGMGNVLSTIVYLGDNEFIDLTRNYVPYNVYVFNVTYNGHLVAGACLTLKYLFDGKPNIEIPEEDAITLMSRGLQQFI